MSKKDRACPEKILIHLVSIMRNHKILEISMIQGKRVLKTQKN